MDLRDALRTTGAIREFTNEPVEDEAVHQILDQARFAPSGGNRQGWRVVLAKDLAVRRALRDLYRPGWYEYRAQVAAGLVGWAPITDTVREREAIAAARDSGPHPDPVRDAFTENFDRCPVLLAIFGDLRAMAAMDRDFDRYTFAGGASVYPFAWSILLAAREYGLGGVLTTMLIRQEERIRPLLRVPDEYALAAVVVLGHPVRRPARLRRTPVEGFTTVDAFDGIPFTASKPA